MQRRPTKFGANMKNIIFDIRHPIKTWRHYSTMRGFEKMFGKFPPMGF